MRKWSAKFLVAAVAVALVTAACGGSDESSSEGGGSESSGETMTINGDTANNHGSVDLTGKDETEVELDDFYFGPTVITGDAGSTVKLELANESNNEHNFTLEDQGIDQDVDAGEQVDVEVTIPDSGSVEFFCKYHKGSGMVGELTAA